MRFPSLISALEDHQLIGRACKHRDMFSLPVLTHEDLTTSYDNSSLLFKTHSLSVFYLTYVVLRVQTLSHSGGYYGEATPVPIPNTEVKLTSVNNTRLATAREDRSLPDYMTPLSQYGEGVFFLLFYFLRKMSYYNCVKMIYWYN